ncbi:MAG: HD domain-containing protein [Planctomycetes bacterium]|nr:HD domain-containing protein [Planctomycetota bacterium]
MRQISVTELTPMPKVQYPVLHTSSVPILMPGEELGEQVIEIMKTMGIEKVLVLDGGDKLEKIRHTITTTPVAVQSIGNGQKLNQGMYDENGVLLLGQDGIISEDFIPSLQRRGITTLYLRKPDEELGTNQGMLLRTKILDLKAAAQEELIAQDPKMIFAPQNLKTIRDIKLYTATLEDLQPHKIRRKLNQANAITYRPMGEPFENSVLDIRKRTAVSVEEKKAYASAVEECLSLLEGMFLDLVTTGKFLTLNLEDITSMIITGTMVNRNLMILLSLEKNKYSYLTSHSLATAVLSVNIASAMGYGIPQIKSLAYSALLADIGMLKLPERLINKQGKLTSLERDKIQQHPVYGIDMLRSTPELPVEVPYVIYQSHEQPNGKGYPCGKKDHMIHPFAKIVRAADIFTALCADRPYRESHNPYQAMEKLVFMTSERMISPEVTKSLLRVVSLFSVGSFVLLSDQSIARIITANPDDYMRPVVSIIWDQEGNSVSLDNRLDLSEHTELSVLRILDENERIALDCPMAGF